MGVTSLWKLVEDDLNPVQLKSLEKKKLAVDASIWIHQFMKTITNRNETETDYNHIIGFFRRICKLLHFGIMPLFVFDGAPPELKKLTMEQRRFRRHNQEFNAKLAAEKLLSSKLQARIVKEISHKNKRAANQTNSSGSERNSSNTQDLTIPQKRQRDEFELPSIERDDKYNFVVGKNATSQTDIRLPTLEEVEAAESWGKIITDRKTASGYDPGIFDFGSENDLQDSSQESANPSPNAKLSDDFIENLSKTFEFDSQEFLELPLDIQHAILKRLKDHSRQTSFKRLKKMIEGSKTAMDFSQMQIEDLMNRNKLMQNYMEVAGATHRIMSLGKNQKVLVNSVASQRGIEYMLHRSEVPGGGYKLSAPSKFIINADTEDTTPVKIKIESKSIESSDDSIELEDSSSQHHFTPDDLIKHVTTPKFNLPTPTKDSSEKIIIRSSKQQDINIISSEGSFDDFEDVPIPTERDDSLKNGNDLLKSNLYPSLPANDKAELSTGARKILNSILDNTSDQNNIAPKVGKNVDKPESKFFVDLCENESDFISDDEIFNFPSNVFELNLLKKDAKNSNLSEIASDNTVTNDYSNDITSIDLSLGSEITLLAGRSGTIPEAIENVEINFGSKHIFQGSSILKLKKNAKPIVDLSLKLGNLNESCDDEKESELNADNKSYSDSLPKQEHLPIEPRIDQSLAHKTTIGSKSLNGFTNVKLCVPTHETQFETESQIEMKQTCEPKFQSSSGLKSDAKNPIDTSDTEASNKDKSPFNFTTPVGKKRSKLVLKSSLGGSSQKSSNAPTTSSSTDVSHNYDTSPFSTGSAESIMSGGPFELKLFSSPTSQPIGGQSASKENDGVLNLSQSFVEDQIKQNEIELLKARRNASTISTSQLDDIRTLLGTFGIPYITAPSEAEATCAYLEQQKIVDGVITDDSDVLLFGATNVYKNFFNMEKTVMKYQRNRTSRFDMIFYAYFLGSDYTVGVSGIGPTTVKVIYNYFGSADSILKTSKYINLDKTELIKNWLNTTSQISKTATSVEQSVHVLIQQLKCFKEFMDMAKANTLKLRNDAPSNLSKLLRLCNRAGFPPGFPDINVARGYMNPNVIDIKSLNSDSESSAFTSRNLNRYGKKNQNFEQTKNLFTWGIPDLDLVQTYMYDKSIWNDDKISAMVLPIIKKMISDKKSKPTTKNQNRQMLLSESFGKKLAQKDSDDKTKESNQSLPSWFL